MVKINNETIIAMSLALSGLSAQQVQANQTQEQNAIYQTTTNQTLSTQSPTYDATNSFTTSSSNNENGFEIFNLISNGRSMTNSSTENETSIYTKIANAIEKKYGPNAYELTEMALCCNDKLLESLGLKETAQNNPTEMNKIRDLALLKLASQETLPENIQQALLSEPNRATIQDLISVNGTLLENNIEGSSLENIALNICNKYNQNATRITELATCKDSELCNNLNIQYPVYTEVMLAKLAYQPALPTQTQDQLVNSPNKADKNDISQIAGFLLDNFQSLENSDVNKGYYGKNYNEIAKQLCGKYGQNAYELTEMALCCNDKLLESLGLKETAQNNPTEMNKIRDLALLKLASQETLPENIQQALLSEPNRATIQDLISVNGTLLENNIEGSSLENIALNICNKYNQNATRITELATCKDSELCNNLNIQYPVYTEVMLAKLAYQPALPTQTQDQLVNSPNKADKNDISQIAGFLLDNFQSLENSDVNKGYYGKNYNEIAKQLCGKYGKDTQALLDKALCGDILLMSTFKTENDDNCTSTIKTLIYGPKLPDSYKSAILQNESASISDKKEIDGQLLNKLPEKHLRETDSLSFTICKKYGKNASEMTRLALEGDIGLATALNLNKEELSQMNKEERCYEFITKLANSNELNTEKQEQLIKQNINRKNTMAMMQQKNNTHSN